MANTTNFGWETPDDTDLVKDGASAMRTLGNAIDTSLVDLKGGTTGQVLSKASNTDMDFTWVAQDDSNAIQNAIVDAKGDLISATAADTPARLPVGTEGQVLTVASAEATGLKWATPNTGLTWTTRLNVGSNTNFNDVAYNGTDLYIAVGNAGTLYTSPDGQTWTSRTSGFGAQNIHSVAYGNSLWAICGSNGLISTSTDGITWTSRTANVGTNTLYHITYANSIWVAVGAGGGTTNTGGITYSTNGTTWTRKAQSITVGANYWMSAWNGTNWIVVADNSTNNYLYASTPSGTWTAGASGTASAMYWVAWDGTRNWVTDTSAFFYYSTSTTLGSVTGAIGSFRAGSNGNVNRAKAYFYNNKIYYSSDQYLQNFTVASNSYPTYSDPTLNPLGIAQANQNSLSANDRTLWVGAAGYIVLGNGKIVCSF